MPQPFTFSAVRAEPPPAAETLSSWLLVIVKFESKMMIPPAPPYPPNIPCPPVA